MEDSAVQLWDWNRWRGDEAVALLRPVARCFWFEVLGVMWKSGATGELSGSYADLAKLSRTTETEARGAIEEIKLRNVADVRDCNGQLTLVCRGMRRQHESREAEERKSARERELTRWRVDNHRRRKAGLPPLPRPESGTVTGEVTPDVTGGVTRYVTTDPSPPFSPSPEPPPPISPTTLSFSTKTSDGLFGSPRADEKPRKLRPVREGKLTPEQVEVRRQLSDWWTREAWPKTHGGVEYEFDGSRDAAAVLKLLRTRFVAWDLNRAKLVCRTYLSAQGDFHARPGRPLYAIVENGNATNHWITQANYAATGRSAGRRRPNAEDRGEFPERQTKLRVLNREPHQKLGAA